MDGSWNGPYVSSIASIGLSTNRPFIGGSGRLIGLSSGGGGEERKTTRTCLFLLTVTWRVKTIDPHRDGRTLMGSYLDQPQSIRDSYN